MTSKVLILGGYGNFGKMISKALIQENIPIVIAGRNKQKAIEFVNVLQKLSYNRNIKPDIQIATLDVNKDLNKLLNNIKPKVVINTCGPFQPIQQTNFKILEECLNTRTNYIDLADGREFIKQIIKYDSKAKQQNITVITGASTAPGLSSALLQKFLPQFKTVESPRSEVYKRGQATARGVMSYVGKKIAPYGQFKNNKYGWQDLYSQYYPGVGSRLMGNIDHPDFDIFPVKYGIKNLNFHAGVENKLLHLGIWLASWMVRLGLPLNLPKYSESLLNLSHALFNWMGSDIGVMHMVISGKNFTGNNYIKKWFLIAKKGDGPNVATVPAINLAYKIIKQNYRLPGVHPCVGLVTLDDYLSYLKKFNIQTFTEQIES